eukprot:TRINITY_DN69445_c0_g1_i1.p1 TRINITY_DN69445_c0_g1~~TRINITY_DN69445_c0_g1_i1.p1  ORF type:complete len:208 (-),score=28.93 TRINITY_DN69445_c0_g1_i1:244-816(-)
MASVETSASALATVPIPGDSLCPSRLNGGSRPSATGRGWAGPQDAAVTTANAAARAVARRSGVASAAQRERDRLSALLAGRKNESAVVEPVNGTNLTACSHDPSVVGNRAEARTESQRLSAIRDTAIAEGARTRVLAIDASAKAVALAEAALADRRENVSEIDIGPAWHAEDDWVLLNEKLRNTSAVASR